MIKIIQPKHIEKINKVAAELLSHLKANKAVISGNYREERIGATVELYRVTRLIGGNGRYQTIEATTDAAFKELSKLVKSLVALLSKDGLYQTYKLKDYANPETLVTKISRDLVSELEELYILGEVNQKDIEQVYANINKPVALKFKFIKPEGATKKVFAAISKAIRADSQAIKNSTTEHYCELAKRIDPDSTTKTPKEFFKLALTKLSDISAVRLCVACKFNKGSFTKLINEEFDIMIAFASYRIVDHCRASDNPKIKVTSLKIGGKGFDVQIMVDDNHLNARAVPVEGCYVRFHYRYIIT